MPKRTNAFQELVAVIHSNLGNGWIVTESMLLQDGITGEMREVDVVAKATVADYDLFISIECRDHRRPADVTWVEGMAKKHESLSTSKLALWSKSGFTKAAIVKAAALKIDTVSQTNAATTDWATLARDLIGGHTQPPPISRHSSTYNHLVVRLFVLRMLLNRQSLMRRETLFNPFRQSLPSCRLIPVSELPFSITHQLAQEIFI